MRIPYFISLFKCIFKGNSLDCCALTDSNNHQLMVARCKAFCKLILLRCITVEELGWGQRFDGLGMRLNFFRPRLHPPVDINMDLDMDMSLFVVAVLLSWLKSASLSYAQQSRKF